MSRKALIIGGAGATAVLVLVLGLYASGGEWGWPTPSTGSSASEEVLDLGITYLPVTAALSHHYQLAVDSGVLVTEVAGGSLADRAGVKVGDVLIGFNGTRLDRGVPLLGLVRTCRPGSEFTVELFRGEGTGVLLLVGGEVK